MSKNNNNGNGQGSKPSDAPVTPPVLSEEELAKQLQDQKDAEALAELEKAEAEKAEAEILEAERLQKDADDLAASENPPVKSEEELAKEKAISEIDETKEYKVLATKTECGLKKAITYKVSGNVAKELLKKGIVSLV